jgi:RimJ/RimL family protein N-acetyltransferase
VSAPRVGALIVIPYTPPVVIETERLSEDALSEADARKALASRMGNRSIESEGDKVSFAVVRRSDGVLVGDCVLAWVSEQHSQGEVGFVMHPDHHGMAYATEGAHALLRIAFDHLELHRVIGRTEARNIASARVMEKLGMRREAHLMENEYVKDEWQSELVYAMLRSEWRDQSTGRSTATASTS